MINKFFTGLAIIILCILFLYIINKGIENKEKDTIPTWSDKHSVELLAIMENEMVSGEKCEHRTSTTKENSKDEKEKGNTSDKKPDSSMVITEDLPDYTKLFPNLYSVNDLPKSMEKGKKIAYLTFDDGPSKNTYKILDILAEEDVGATFFVVGSAIDRKVENSLIRMVNEGHTIGIHSYSHLCNEIYCSIERFLDDFNIVYEQIYEITGERVNLYRFPWGSNNGYTKGIKDALIDEMSRRGFSCYDWNVSADDSVGKPSAYSILHNIEKDLSRYDYPIILLHDSKINNLTVKLLPQIIKLLRSKGYEFGTLSEREPYKFEW